MTNHITYAGQSVRLCKHVCLISDETQDLPVEYAEAIVRIMRERYMDSYIVGDKLQSLSLMPNAFTYLCDSDNPLPYIHKELFEYTNLCRRFSDPLLVKFVNEMVPFDKYQLPPTID